VTPEINRVQLLVAGIIRTLPRDRDTQSRVFLLLNTYREKSLAISRFAVSAEQRLSLILAQSEILLAELEYLHAERVAGDVGRFAPRPEAGDVLDQLAAWLSAELPRPPG
jgi:hypothetical protein